MAIRTVIGDAIRSIQKSKNMWSLGKLERELMKTYEGCQGYSFDINSPTLFTEKLQYYKLYYRDQSLVNAVDKYLFKDFIRERIGDGYTVPLYDVWESISDFSKGWNRLPEEFVIKSTLQSDGKYIEIVHEKSKQNFSRIRHEVKKWFNPKNTLINSYCRAYHSATPRVIAEKYLEQVDNQLYDYKFFCFSGEPHYIYVATDHFPGQLSHISFYDLEWNQLNVKYGEHPNCKVEKPKHFEEMLKLARILSADYPFVRVDFFDTNEQLYVAELTFYPGGGLTPYYPKAFNKKLGDLFILPYESDAAGGTSL